MYGCKTYLAIRYIIQVGKCPKDKARGRRRAVRASRNEESTKNACTSDDPLRTNIVKPWRGTCHTTNVSVVRFNINLVQFLDYDVRGVSNCNKKSLKFCFLNNHNVQYLLYFDWQWVVRVAVLNENIHTNIHNFTLYYSWGSKKECPNSSVTAHLLRLIHFD